MLIALVVKMESGEILNTLIANHTEENLWYWTH